MGVFNFLTSSLKLQAHGLYVIEFVHDSDACRHLKPICFDRIFAELLVFSVMDKPNRRLI